MSSQVVLEAQVMDRDSVVITQGTFYSCIGQQIDIIMEDWSGVTDSETEPDFRSTNPPFAPDEIALISRAVVTSGATIACPRCGCPLTRERLPGHTQLDTWLVACILCRRHLVIRHGS